MIPSLTTSYIFDRRLLRQRRARLCRASIDQNRLFAFLQQQLKVRLCLIKRDFQTILVLGDVELSNHFKQAQLWSFSPTAKFGVAQFDDEFLPFAPAQFDLIISFMEMHHFNDIPGFLQQVKFCLKPDGLFLSVFLGQDTLWQLRHAAQIIEEKIYGGISPRVAPMVKLSDAAALMQRAGFTLPVVDMDQIEITYPNAERLIQDLKKGGLGNIMLERPTRFAEKQFLQQLTQFYDQHYQIPEGVGASFTAIYLSGWSAAPHQPKPLARGSATAQLADFIK